MLGERPGRPSLRFGAVRRTCHPPFHPERVGFDTAPERCFFCVRILINAAVTE